jgi:hypothetical protein
MERHVDRWLAVVTGRHAPEIGSLEFLKIYIFCPVVRSMDVDAS